MVILFSPCYNMVTKELIPMNVKIAENIRAMRKERKLSQEQLAEAMGVTVGAVSKWELGASVPDIGTIMELADFFETSVDVLLGYEWKRHSQEQAVEEIRQLRIAKRFDEGIRAAEKALQKYPNSFEVVYQSGFLYYLMLDREHAARAKELLERACELIGQNPYEDVNLMTIQDQIAMCYAYMNRYDEAVERLKKNNIGGRNDSLIGNLLSQHCRKPEEGLQYLSKALGKCQTDLYRISLGYANAYAELGKFGEAYDIMKWMYDLCQGLRDTSRVTYMDKGDVRTLVVLAEISAVMGDGEKAYAHLKQAKELAARFDAAPEYSMKGMRFFHGMEEATMYDDFGDTAREGILRFLEDDEAAPHLRPYWERLMEEELHGRAGS